MNEPKQDAPEPSMEEILSSIRRIIAEEEETGAPRPQIGMEASPRPGNDPNDDVLELTNRIDDGAPFLVPQQRLSPPDPSSPRIEEPKPQVSAKPVDKPAAIAAPPLRQEPSVAEPSPLVSSSAAAVSAAALSKLARAATPTANEAPLPFSSMTVEQLLVSMLEPMLKDWFDKNLPAVVERIVEEEVKKLVRRAELQ
jgi:cell pole-organizing protein PopZ